MCIKKHSLSGFRSASTFSAVQSVLKFYSIAISKTSKFQINKKNILNHSLNFYFIVHLKAAMAASRFRNVQAGRRGKLHAFGNTKITFPDEGILESSAASIACKATAFPSIIQKGLTQLAVAVWKARATGCNSELWDSGVGGSAWSSCWGKINAGIQFQ